MPTPTASEIIERVKARYAGCRTYQDEGEETQVTILGPSPWQRSTERKLFRTLFSRPDCYFFESREVGVGPESEWERFVLCANGGGANSWERSKCVSGSSPEQLSGTLADLIGPASGLCGTTIASLLLPEMRSGRVVLPENASVAEPVSIEGVECFGITGDRRTDLSPFTVWVECATHLLRRLDARLEFNAKWREGMLARMKPELSKPGMTEEQREAVQFAVERYSGPHDDFTTETTIVWHPRMNHAIDPKVFEFTPPA